MNYLFTILILFIYAQCFGQIRIFNGYIDKYPIQLVAHFHPDGKTNAIYAYNKHDTPIIIDGILKNDTLTLFEKNVKGEISATLDFHKFNPTNKEINGNWISQNKQTKFTIKLTKLREFDYNDKSAFDKLELMQQVSTKDNYFKLLLSKKVEDDIQVTGVRIYEKKTDQLIQELNLDCQFIGLDNISVGDYNFDGIEDFSVFEYPSSSVYILRVSNSREYFVSEIAGNSLEFDSDSGLIYEHNQCCSGRVHSNTIYKLVDNKMIIVNQNCFEYDDEKDDFVDKECD